MLEIRTPTKVLTNRNVYGRNKTTRYLTDADADKLAETTWIKETGGFVVEYKKIPTDKPTVSFIAEKSDLEKVLKVASPEEIKEAGNSMLLLQAKRREVINITREIEAFIGSYNSEHTQKSYGYQTNIFLKYCGEQGLDPRMITPIEGTEFQNWLRFIGKSKTVIRHTIKVLHKLYEKIWIHQNISDPSPFDLGSLPRKTKEKMTYVPNEAEVAKILAFFKDNPIVFTAIHFMQKYGMRIGAFEKLTIFGNHATTITKGKRQHFIFDEKDTELWRTNPLNNLTATQLDDRVNYRLKQAFLGNVTKYKYTCHDFRRFFAVKLYNETKDVLLVSKKLGHSNIATTNTYLMSLREDAIGYTLVE